MKYNPAGVALSLGDITGFDTVNEKSRPANVPRRLFVSFKR
jgi:hypothetical protein